MGRLDGKVALITGGACGIGRGHSELFAKEGAKVVVTTRKKVDIGAALAESIKKQGGEAIFLRLDITIEDGKVKSYRARVNVSFKYQK